MSDYEVKKPFINRNTKTTYKSVVRVLHDFCIKLTPEEIEKLRTMSETELNIFRRTKIEEALKD